MTLGGRLVTSFLGCGLIPLGIIAYVSYTTADSSMTSLQDRGKAGLEQTAYNQMTALRDVKKAQIEKYFAERRGDLSVLVRTVGTLRAEAFDKLTAIQAVRRRQMMQFFNERRGDIEVLARSDDVHRLLSAVGQYREETGTPADGPLDVTTEQYRSLVEAGGEDLIHYQKIYGYDDLLIICAAQGHVLWSAAGEQDLGTNLGHGPYRDSSLADLWRKVVGSERVRFVDLAPYAPSGNQPAMFVGGPIRDRDTGEVVGVVACQISLAAIDNIMSERSGMGETGECYLVGPDRRMRSNSHLDPEGHSVMASLNGTVEQNGVDTEAVRRALSGSRGTGVVIDYNGNPVLSCYAPFEIDDFRWVALCEIDVAEAFCPKDDQGVYFYKEYAELYGYYDLFLINPDGHCFYTVCRESDYDTNLLTGRYSDSHLGGLVREVLDRQAFGFADFQAYEPTNGAPAAFIAQPVVHDGKTELVVALQLPLEGVNSIMSLRCGMGETGETYLVGPDHLMRSDSYLDPAHHSVAASFRNPAEGAVETEAARAALAGEADAGIITDYNGNPVLSAYAPVEVCGRRWAVLAEIDQAEALAAARDMEATGAASRSRLVTWVGTLAAVAAALVTLTGLLIARSISRPITRIIAGLNEGADQVNDAARQVSSASQQLAEGASEQAASLEETSSSLEQMAAMTRTNAENAKQANQFSTQARSAAETGDQTMGKLNGAMTAINESSGQISKIIKVIEEIAFQTNLLALNAAVEAARAGEHGKGFAVVADEVRNLAQRCAQAARETTELIEDSVSKAREGTGVATEVGTALGTIVTDVAKVTELINGITQASQEQAQGVDQVNTAVSQMDKVTQQNASGAEESASAAEELSAQAQTVKSIVEELAALISGARQQSRGGRPQMPRPPSGGPRATAGGGRAAAAAPRPQAPNPEFVALRESDEPHNF